MAWNPIETMPFDRKVQIGNIHWTHLATHKVIGGEHYIENDYEDIPFDETTATHWREYDGPPPVEIETEEW